MAHMVGAVSQTNIAHKILYRNKEHAWLFTLFYRTLGNVLAEFSTFLPLLFLLPSLSCLGEIKPQVLTALLQGRWFQNTNTTNAFKITKKNDLFKGKQ